MKTIANLFDGSTSSASGRGPSLWMLRSFATEAGLELNAASDFADPMMGVGFCERGEHLANMTMAVANIGR